MASEWSTFNEAIGVMEKVYGNSQFGFVLLSLYVFVCVLSHGYRSMLTSISIRSTNATKPKILA